VERLTRACEQHGSIGLRDLPIVLGCFTEDTADLSTKSGASRARKGKARCETHSLHLRGSAERESRHFIEVAACRAVL